MNKKIISGIIAFLLVLTTIASVSAITIGQVSTQDLTPGKTGRISIELENNLEYDIEDVSFKLNFESLPFIPVGSSEETIDEIDEDDDESASFRVQAANDITPGDYEIPYSLEYEDPETNSTVTKSGTIGVRVRANPILAYSIETENPVEDMQGRVTLKIVNKGFFDARFVSININSNGFTLLSDSEVYIGTIDSDDYETATFDVIFTSRSPTLTASVEYIDFDNEEIIETINLPVKVYSQERAIELGLIQKSNAPLYIGIVIALLVIWFIYRAIRKRRRFKKGMQNRR